MGAAATTSRQPPFWPPPEMTERESKVNAEQGSTAPGSTVAPRRSARTYNRDGREHYADTGRPVDERLGSHVVLWIVDDAQAWAAAIEARADAELAGCFKRDRGLGEQRRSQAYESAARIREEGQRRTVYMHCHDAESAEACATDLRRSHPNPGVRYEVAAIVEARACPDCHQPSILAAGQWWHHSGRYPATCVQCPDPEMNEELERIDGEWLIDIGVGAMVCGYCNEETSWAVAALGYAKLTGYHLLGIERATGVLVVLAEAMTLSGETAVLPHHCDKIPDDVRAAYEPEGTQP